MIMKCQKCNTDMINSLITGNSLYSLILTNKKKGLFESEKRSDVLCYVCPKCGYIELYAKEPNNLVLVK